MVLELDRWVEDSSAAVVAAEMAAVVAVVAVAEGRIVDSWSPLYSVLVDSGCLEMGRSFRRSFKTIS